MVQRRQHFDMSQRDAGGRRPGVVLSAAERGELQQVLLAMLDDVIGVCERRGIRCFLVGGTALGAIRHRGFIPWDDDADIAVFRRDHARLLAALGEERPARYEVQSPEHTAHYPSLITRIRLRGTEAMSREDLWTDHGGVALDVFVIENVFDSAVFRLIQGAMSIFFTGLLACRKSFAIRKKMAGYRIPAAGHAVKNAVRCIVGGMFAWLPVGFFRRAALFFNRLCCSETSRFVSIPSGRLLFFNDMYRREIFAEARSVDFAGRRFSLPVRAEEYLEHCYGDWRKTPENTADGTHFLCSFSIGGWRKNFAADEVVPGGCVGAGTEFPASSPRADGGWRS